jgi:hypothetical protein
MKHSPSSEANTRPARQDIFRLFIKYGKVFVLLSVRLIWDGYSEI